MRSKTDTIDVGYLRNDGPALDEARPNDADEDDSDYRAVHEPAEMRSAI